MAPHAHQHHDHLETGLLGSPEEKTVVQRSGSLPAREPSSQEDPPKEMMPSPRCLMLTVLVCFLATFGLASVLHHSKGPCLDGGGRTGKEGTEAKLQVQDNASESGFSQLLRTASPDILHRLLHAYFPERYQDGVYPSDHDALVAVHRGNAPLATSLARLARRQDGGTNTTVTSTPGSSSSPPSSTPPPTPTPDPPAPDPDPSQSDDSGDSSASSTPPSNNTPDPTPKPTPDPTPTEEPNNSGTSPEGKQADEPLAEPEESDDEPSDEPFTSPDSSSISPTDSSPDSPTSSHLSESSQSSPDENPSSDIETTPLPDSLSLSSPTPIDTSGMWDHGLVARCFVLDNLAH